MSNHGAALIRATADWAQLTGLTHAFQAAVLRGDAAAAEQIRAQAHDVLDANLDRNSEAARAIQALLAGR